MTLVKVWAKFKSPKFKIATVGQFDYCILNGLAYISALDMVFGVTLGKEFISGVRFIIVHNGLP